MSFSKPLSNPGITIKKTANIDCLLFIPVIALTLLLAS